MIAEENIFERHQNDLPEIDNELIIGIILENIKISSRFFRIALTQPDLILPLNENKLTQIFVSQLNTQLHKKSLPFCAQLQFFDLFLGSKGIPDIYIQPFEEGQTLNPLFIIEAKRLPAPDPRNKKEYVIGNNKNGGIQRFKIEKHGKGSDECGMIGFLESEDYNYWKANINSLINELSKTDSKNWSTNEFVEEIEAKDDFTYLISKVDRPKSSKLKLHHIWVNKNP